MNEHIIKVINQNPGINSLNLALKVMALDLTFTRMEYDTALLEMEDSNSIVTVRYKTPGMIHWHSIYFPIKTQIMRK